MKKAVLLRGGFLEVKVVCSRKEDSEARNLIVEPSKEVFKARKVASEPRKMVVEARNRIV